jgi:aryl-alcohol dehydrogenase-like predicted oxidoreductase
MQYAPLGSTDIQVSRLCMGTATFGGQSDDAASFAILDACAAEGVNFIDTANVYPLASEPKDKGHSERIVGQWLTNKGKGQRHQFILATKGGGVMSPLPGASGNSRQHLLGAIDASLKRLGTDHVDLYQLHYDDANTPLDETLATLDTIVRSGRARCVGMSNFQPWRLARAIGRCETHDWARPVSVQPRYNLLFRQIERDLVSLCREENLGMICYNPLAGGLLSGKHHFTAQPDANTRFGNCKGADMYKERYWHEREFLAISLFLDLAAQAGMEPVRLAVAWVLAQPAVTSVILGASRADQLPHVLSAPQAVINADLLASLNAITREFRRGDASR